MFHGENVKALYFLFKILYIEIPSKNVYRWMKSKKTGKLQEIELDTVNHWGWNYHDWSHLRVVDH